jgi:hypothetical protein
VGAFVPKVVHVTSCPARVGCHFIGEVPTQFVKENENLIVNLLDLSLYWADVLIIELLSAITNGL